MPYIYWLVVISAAFVVLERLFPWRREQRLLRAGWLRDLGFLVFNGHVFSLWTAGAAAWLALGARQGLLLLGWTFDSSPLRSLGFAGQLAVYLLATDLLQWGIHNLLHRVPFLWEIHKVHHAITTMDWIGSFRFHWMEIVVYRTLQWLPLVWLGAPDGVVLVVAVIGTAWGHFNHSNLGIGLGPAGYVFNNPRMHLWHHDASSEGGTAKNFAVMLSLWDWLFGTAYWPRDRSPRRLGYPGIEEMPAGLAGELLFPLTRKRSG